MFRGDKKPERLIRRETMKSEKSDASKSKKHRQAEASKMKPPCGTLTYLAECRGVTQKPDATRWTAPPENMNRIVRKYPAGS